MGSGKSVTAKRLSGLLKYDFVDLDSEIEKKQNRSIADIFREYGEERFRDLEEQVFAEVAKQDRIVLATGGGIILRGANVQKMKETGAVVYLRTSPDVLWQRVASKSHRPLLNTENPEGSLRNLFMQRKDTYEKTCDHAVDTDGKAPEEVAIEISTMLENIK